MGYWGDSNVFSRVIMLLSQRMLSIVDMLYFSVICFIVHQAKHQLELLGKSVKHMGIFGFQQA